MPPDEQTDESDLFSPLPVPLTAAEWAGEYDAALRWALDCINAMPEAPVSQPGDKPETLDR